jgi:hypothetical protein
VELDLRMLLTIGGMLVSVVSAAIIVRQRLQQVVVQLQDVEKRLRAVDIRVDKSEVRAGTANQSLEILSSMLSPDRREKTHRELATIAARLASLERETIHLKTMHNTQHPPLP